MARLVPLASLCLLFGIACAAPARAEDPAMVITVKDVRNPELRSYRAVLAGLDAFDEHRALLAPQAPAVRFRLQPRKDGTPIEGLAMRLAGDKDSIPIAIGADGLFTVPRSSAAWDDNAEFILNRKRGLFASAPEVRTPGLPDNVMRLGDLRLECQVAVAIVKKEMPFYLRAAVNALALTGDWCNNTINVDKEYLAYSFRFPAHAQFNRATMVDGERRKALKTGSSGFEVPLGDPRWPNDTLIEFEKAEVGPQVATQP